MASNMINFPSILAFATRSIFIRFIDQNFHTAASAFAFISTFFLYVQSKDVWYEWFSPFELLDFVCTIFLFLYRKKKG